MRCAECENGGKECKWIVVPEGKTLIDEGWLDVDWEKGVGKRK